ncbi:MAG TPA: sugar ABC transporter permease [Firmicutes bacterium]|nr:sugar ABC transporter permease [Bacillota bacterium]
MNNRSQRTLFRKWQVQENITSYLFLAPSLLFFTVFTAIPIVTTIFIFSFSNCDFLTPISFVGLDNYKTLFSDPDFKTVVINTLKFISFIAPMHIILGLLLAVAVTSVKNKFMKGFFRTAFYFPLTVTTVSVAIAWGFMYDYNFGVINYFLKILHLPAIQWLISTKWSLLAVAIFSAWKFIGNAFLYYLIGLQNIPDSYMEAASIDGANAFQKFFLVKLPLLTPTLFFVITITLINCFQMFDEPFFLTKGGPGVSSTTMAMHIYRRGFGEYHFGYASTLGVILFVAVLIVTFVQFSFQNKWVSYDYE